MIDKRNARRLVGETLRDIGILLIVFGPLDAFFQMAQPSVVVLVLLVAAGLCFITLGIIIEAQDPGAAS